MVMFIPLTLPVVIMEGTETIRRQRIFTYNTISLTGLNSALLVAAPVVAVRNVCGHEVC